MKAAPTDIGVDVGPPLFGPVNLLTFWLALVLLVPSVLVVPGMGALGKPATLFGLALAFFWVLERLRGRTNSHLGFPWVYVALGVYLFGNAMSYAASHLRGVSSDDALAMDRWVLTTIGLCGVALIAADGLTTRGDIDKVLRRTMTILAIEAGLGAIQFFTEFDPIRYLRLPGLVQHGAGDLSIIRDISGSDFDRVASTAGHPIEFGVLMAAVLPLAVHYSMFSRGSPWHRTLRISTLLIAFGVPISIGRSSTITLLVGMLALATVWTKRQLLQASFIGVIAVFGLRAAVPSLIGTILSLFKGLGDDPSISARTNDYEQAFAFIAQDPWFGRGPDTLDPERYILLDNQILKSTIETGYFGVFCLFAMIIIVLNLTRTSLSRGADDTTRHLSQALFGTITAFTMTMFFADMLFFSQFAGLLFLFIGLAGALNRVKGLPRPADETDRRGVLRESLTVARRPPDHA